MSDVRKIQTDEELKIFSDPYRMKIINAYIKAGKPLTVKGVADLMGEVPAKVHYHVKKLLTINILFLDHTEMINGITAKYYKLTTENFQVSYENTPSQPALFDSTTNMLISVIDEFKEDIYRNARYLKTHKESMNIPRKGFITKEELYLNEENYEKFNEEMKLLYLKYRNVSDEKTTHEKEKYDFFVGWSRQLK